MRHLAGATWADWSERLQREHANLHLALARLQSRGSADTAALAAVLRRLSEPGGDPVASQARLPTAPSPDDGERPPEAPVHPSDAKAEWQTVGRHFWADVVTTAGWREHIGFAAANLLPSPAFLRERYQIRNPWLTPLCYPYRWWLCVRSPWACTGQA